MSVRSGVIVKMWKTLEWEIVQTLMNGLSEIRLLTIYGCVEKIIGNPAKWDSHFNMKKRHLNKK